MPYIVLIYTSHIHNENTLKSIFVYLNIKTVINHSKHLLGCYDLRKKRNTSYVTYKSYFSLKEITWEQFKILKHICMVRKLINQK